jgi:hypothetical protein
MKTGNIMIGAVKKATVTDREGILQEMRSLNVRIETLLERGGKKSYIDDLKKTKLYLQKALNYAY